jgi:hypothetical protein
MYKKRSLILIQGLAAVLIYDNRKFGKRAFYRQAPSCMIDFPNQELYNEIKLYPQLKRHEKIEETLEKLHD